MFRKFFKWIKDAPINLITKIKNGYANQSTVLWEIHMILCITCFINMIKMHKARKLKRLKLNAN